MQKVDYTKPIEIYDHTPCSEMHIPPDIKNFSDATYRFSVEGRHYCSYQYQNIFCILEFDDFGRHPEALKPSIRNVVEIKKPREFWINVYGNLGNIAHFTFQSANSAVNSKWGNQSRTECIHVREVRDEDEMLEISVTHSDAVTNEITWVELVNGPMDYALKAGCNLYVRKGDLA